MTVLAVLDVETTGEDPTRHSIAELAVVWVELLRGGSRLLGWGSALTRFRGTLDPRIRAVHHLHPARLARARPAATVLLHLWRPGVQGVAAHWAPFDMGFVAPVAARVGIDLPPVLCTHRLALHLVPDAPSHSLQALRYLVGLRVRPPGWAHPHRALHDALVAAELLRWELGELKSDLGEALHLSTTPVTLTQMKFGQHRGKAWRDVPGSYLRWMQREVAKDEAAFDLDTRYTLDAELSRRSRPRTAVNTSNGGAASDVVIPTRDNSGGEPSPGTNGGGFNHEGGAHDGGTGAGEAPIVHEEATTA